MKKIVKVIGFFLFGLLLMVGCTKENKVSSADLSDDINKFVGSNGFINYNAVVSKFSENDAGYIFPYSSISTKKLQGNRYETVIEGIIDDKKEEPYGKYLTLTISAKPDEKGHLNLDEFTTKDEFNDWFKIIKVEKNKKNYDILTKKYKDKVDIGSILPEDISAENPIHKNTMYKNIEKYYEIPNQTEELSESYAEASGITEQLRNGFQELGTMNQQVKEGLSSKINENFSKEELGKLKYTQTARISKNYYIVLLSENAVDNIEDVKAIIIFKDTDPKDTTLSSLEFIDLKKK
ncbi:hypothetical protein [Bacillus paramycoides]|uniref:hypothetical protein n=1 Tax=Bacillus paramycoides TaxID=2026194 RepID=UPI003D24A132